MAGKQHVLNPPSASTTAAAGRFRLLLVAGLVLTGLSMRTAVTSVGAALDELQRGLHIGSGMAGVVTTLPVICFAVLGAVTPRLAHGFGSHRLLVVSMTAMTIGLLLRALVGSIWLFVPLSLIALTGAAVSNILMPSLVKQHFPHAIGRMTSVYTTAMAVGTTIGAGLTEPLGSLGGGWRTGLGSWALVSAVAVLPWLPTLRAERAERDDRDMDARAASVLAMRHSPTAWALTIFFGFQAFQAYIAFGWFAKFLHAHGVTTSGAGWLLALLAAMSIPVSMIVPRVPAERQRIAVAVLSACYLAGYLGLSLDPDGASWLWMVLAGIGSGTFPVALTLIGLRSRTSDTTAALSAFSQSIGYLIGGCGPVLFGVLHGATGGWAVPFALLYGGLALSFGSAVIACRPAYVDDELALSAAVPASPARADR
jgi:MFS transporter, CP family, cyanate transporter